jgi:3-deoxy-D-manno-octulosonic-acid transferase
LKFWRGVYTLTTATLLPVLTARLLFKSMRNRDYRQRIAERFACNRLVPDDRTLLWVHAVSVGEVLAVAPLVALWKKDVTLDVVITTTTPTGSRQVRAAFGDRVKHCYVPFDLSGFIRRFIRKLNIKALVVVETEIWPNMLATARANGLPCFLVNARLSARSCARYARWPQFSRWMLSHFDQVITRDQVDADRFMSLGVSTAKCQVLGNMKFDFSVDADVLSEGGCWREQHFATRPVWIAASTHRGEEELILRMHQRIVMQYPDALLLLVPRHPERFTEVFAVCQASGFTVLRRSQQTTVTEMTQVYLVDSMGELMFMYAASDVVFVGGSLVAVGGHNFIEPAALAKPMLSGEHVFNFQSVAASLRELGALRCSNNIDALAEQVCAWFSDHCARADCGSLARDFVHHNRGAVARVAAVIQARLNTTRPS